MTIGTIQRDAALGPISVAGSHLVVGEDRGQGPTVTCWSLEDGAREWSVPAPDAASVPTWWGFDAGLIVGIASSGSGELGVVGFDPGTGAEREVPADLLLGHQALAGGGKVGTRLQASQSSPVAVVALEPDGTRRWTVSGIDAPPPIRQGSPDVVTVFDLDTGLIGVDARTGATLWADTGDATSALPMALVDGVLVVGSVDMSVTRARVLDARSGTELWQADGVGSVFTSSLAIDGAHLAAAVIGGGASRAVVHDLLDGREVAEWPLPLAGASRLEVLPDGRLVQVGSSQIVMLGP